MLPIAPSDQPSGPLSPSIGPHSFKPGMSSIHLSGNWAPLKIEMIIYIKFMRILYQHMMQPCGSRVKSWFHNSISKAGQVTTAATLCRKVSTYPLVDLGTELEGNRIADHLGDWSNQNQTQLLSDPSEWWTYVTWVCQNDGPRPSGKNAGLLALYWVLTAKILISHQC